MEQILFILFGSFLTLLLQYFYEKYRIRKRRKYFFYCLIDLYVSVVHQINIYKEYLDKIKSGENSIPSLPISLGFNLESIKSVQQEDLYYIFVTKGNNIHDLRNLMRGFNKIQYILDKRKNDYENFSQQNKSIISEFYEMNNKFYGSLKEIYDNMVNYDEPTKKTVLEIEACVNKFNDNKTITKKASVFDTAENLFKPLDEIVKGNKATFLLAELDNLVHTYIYLKDIRDNYATVKKEDLGALEFIKSHYEKLIDSYSKYFTKELKQLLNEPTL